VSRIRRFTLCALDKASDGEGKVVIFRRRFAPHDRDTERGGATREGGGARPVHLLPSVSSRQTESVEGRGKTGGKAKINTISISFRRNYAEVRSIVGTRT